MRPHQKLSLKEFSEEVEAFLTQSTESDLRHVIRRWAAETDSKKRHAFISRLTAKQSTQITETSGKALLLQDIAEVISEVEDMAIAEPDWEQYDQDDEDSLGGFEEFVEPITTLFDRVEQAFETKPSLEKLIALFESAKEPERAELMRRASDVIGDHLSTPPAFERDKVWERDFAESPASVDKNLLAHAYLLARLPEKALSLARAGKALGWSSSDNAQPFCVAYGLVHSSSLSPQDLPPNLRTFWVSTAHRSQIWNDAYFDPESKARNTFAQQIDEVYKQVIGAHPLSHEFADWCFKAAEDRVNAIVSNNHRRAYGRAALLTAASYEALLSMQKAEEAKVFLNRIRERFPRHSAFQRELQSHIRQPHKRGLR